MASAVSNNVLSNGVAYDLSRTNLHWIDWVNDNPPTGAAFSIGAPAGTFLLSGSVTFATISALPATMPLLQIIRNSDAAILASVPIQLVDFGTVITTINATDISASGDAYFLSTISTSVQPGIYSYQNPATFQGNWTAAGGGNPILIRSARAPHIIIGTRTRLRCETKIALGM